MENIQLKLYQNTLSTRFYAIEEDKKRNVEHICEIDLRKHIIKDFDFEQRNDHFTDWFGYIPTSKEAWNRAVEEVMRNKLL